MSTNDIIATNNSTEQPGAASLSPVLSANCVLRWQHTVVCMFFAIVFLYLSYIPLFHTEIWLHAAHGNFMLQNQGLSGVETFLPLAEGMTYVSTSWFSQLLFASAVAWLGAEGLSSLLAVTQIASLIVLAFAFYRQTQRKRLMLFGVFFVIALWWGQLGILRPQVFGGLCLAILLTMLVRLPQWNWQTRVREMNDSDPPDDANTASTLKTIPGFQIWTWVLIPALMLLWANLDGSFVVGLLVLISHALGRGIDVARQEKRMIPVFKDKSFRNWVWLTELALLATLANPLGWDLWAQAVRIDGNSIWQAAGGWRPLSLASLVGAGFASFWLLSLFLLRRSRVQVRATDVILLSVATLAVICNGLLIWWFAPLAMLVAMPYLGEVFAAGEPKQANVKKDDARSLEAEESRPLRFAFTLLCLLIVWTAFAFSPVSSPIFNRKSRDLAQLHNSQTPLGVSSYLKKHAPDKLVWAPQAWSDWLIWDGPEGIQLFSNSEARLLPQQVQYDNGRIARGDGGWTEVLDRYDVGTLVIDKQSQPILLRSAKRSDQKWRVAYEDDQALVMTRKAVQLELQDEEGKS